jgi:uncharacterized damage-inducible protein DinB
MRPSIALVTLTLAMAAVVPSRSSSTLVAQELQSTIARDLVDVERKLVGLAQTFPQADYGWRPMEGVRSVSEVLMHVVVANYVILARIGAEIPEGDPQAWLADPDSFTDQAVAVDALQRSFAFARDITAGVSDGDLWAQAPQAGEGTTVGSQLLLLQYHAHEHLGQMIAYARSNQITPPWSR